MIFEQPLPSLGILWVLNAPKFETKQTAFIVLCWFKAYRKQGMETEPTWQPRLPVCPVVTEEDGGLGVNGVFTTPSQTA